METHYLDNAATTRVSDVAAAAVLDAMTVRFGNPSSVHSLGVEAERMNEGARSDIAAALGCLPGELIFTSGGTESDNMAIIRGAELAAKRGGHGHVVTSLAEHDAVINSVKYLESRGFEVSWLRPDSDGSVSPEALEAVLRPDTALVSLMLVNNETGAPSQIDELVRVTRRAAPQALFHTDAVQAFMKHRFTVRSLGVDMLSVSSHKIHGPKGAGALYLRRGVRLKPLILGGGQEHGLRSGTEATPVVAGFAAAVREAAAEIDRNIERVGMLAERLCSGLERIPGVEIIAANGAIVNFAVPRYPSEVTIRMLEQTGVFVSGGSACARGRASHVLEAMGVERRLVQSAIRASISWKNTEEDVDALLSAVGGL